MHLPIVRRGKGMRVRWLRARVGRVHIACRTHFHFACGARLLLLLVRRARAADACRMPVSSMGPARANGWRAAPSSWQYAAGPLLASGFWLLASGFWLLGPQVCSLPGIDGRQRDAGEQVSRPALEFASACTITVDFNCPLILVAIRVP